MSEKTELRLINFKKCQADEVGLFIREHLEGFLYHLDSWPEERLTERDKFLITVDGQGVGYAVIHENSIYYFYVNQEHFHLAPRILMELVEKKEIRSVFVLTQDRLLSALIAEWDYEKEMLACGFFDTGNGKKSHVLEAGEIFRAATGSDCDGIREMSGDFFHEPGAGYNSLEERIDAGTIFVLMENEKIMGGGILERSQLFKGTVSIGMYTSKHFRKRGVARKILLNLKNQAYEQNLRPVAGCWYYNTLSRKSLEASGMIVTSICFEAILKGKQKLPLRTGNPPGELVE